jgi:hypothetical protein
VCKRDCAYLGYKIPVPPRQKIREWSALREQLAREHIAREAQQDRQKIRSRHDLEQEIVRLEAMPANPGRNQAIGLLRRRLERSNA